MSLAMPDVPSGPRPRRSTVAVRVGGVEVGGGAPIVVQSMTNTDTADVEATARQVAALARAGSELVRITVDRDEAAAAVPHIRDALLKRGVRVPLIGDFHYIGHKLLADHPACAEALDKYRINPGNVGFKNKRDLQFGKIVEIAIRNGKPVRIGANWGSLDQDLLTSLMDENAASAAPLEAGAVTREAMVRSALLSAARAEEIGLARDRIILSAKVSSVQDLITVYRMLGERSDYALHLGLTEAGMGSKGIVASSAALGVLLQEGLGDTIRISLTPEPGGDRTQEVKVAQELLQTMGFRSFAPAGRRLSRLRAHDLDRVPGAGARHRDLSRPVDAGVAQDLSGRRAPQRRGDGLHRQRTRREQARQYRHLAAGNRRSAGRAGVRRRGQDRDPSGRAHRRGVQGAGQRLHRQAIRVEPAGGGIGARVARPPLPPFTRETAAQKARMAEDAWNSRDPARVALAYSEDSRWRNRAEFISGRPAIEAFLTRKWNRELDYRLIKEVWAFHDARIAVRFAYEWRDDFGKLVPLVRQRELGVRRGRADAGAPRQHQRSADPRAGPPLPLAARPSSGRSSRPERPWALRRAGLPDGPAGPPIWIVLIRSRFALESP